MFTQQEMLSGLLLKIQQYLLKVITRGLPLGIPVFSFYNISLLEIIKWIFKITHLLPKDIYDVYGGRNMWIIQNMYITFILIMWLPQQFGHQKRSIDMSI